MLYFQKGKRSWKQQYDVAILHPENQQKIKKSDNTCSVEEACVREEEGIVFWEKVWRHR